MNLPVAGGGYFRLLPYRWTRWGIARLNERERRPAIFYLHPWEIDPGPAAAPGRLRSAGSGTTATSTRPKPRLRRLLRDFRFAPLGRARWRCRRTCRAGADADVIARSPTFRDAVTPDVLHARPSPPTARRSSSSSSTPRRSSTGRRRSRARTSSVTAIAEVGRLQDVLRAVRAQADVRRRLSRRRDAVVGASGWRRSPHAASARLARTCTRG